MTVETICGMYFVLVIDWALVPRAFMAVLVWLELLIDYSIASTCCCY